MKPVLSGLALLGLTVGIAHAAMLDPIDITDTRDSGESPFPASTTVITAEEIARSTARDLPALLAQQAGIAVRSLYGGPSRASVDLRGFGATAAQNTLILLDGRRLNDLDLSDIDFAAIPLNNIERVEILRGSGSVLYGDGAVGGAINIVTRRGTRSALHGGLNFSGGSYDTGQGEAKLSFGGDSYAANLYATRLESDNYRDNNRIEQTNGQADLRAYVGDDELYLKFGSDDQQLRLPGALTVDPMAGIDQLADDRRGTNTPFDYADQDGKRVSFGWQHALSGGGSLVLDGGLRHKNQQAFYDGGCQPLGFVCSSFLDTDLDTWSFTPRVKLPNGLFGRRGSSTFGLDWYYADYGSDRAQDAGLADVHRLTARQWNASLYGQSTFELIPKLDATLGVRVQRVELKARDRFDAMAPGAAFGSEATPLSQGNTEHALEAGLTRHFGNAAVHARYARNLRFATVDELFEFNRNFMQVFSPLKPQTGQTVDTGIDIKHGRLQAGLDLYYGWYRNEIHFNPIDFTNINLDPTRRYGSELSLGYQLLDSVRLTGRYSYTRAEFDDGANEGNDVPLVPKHLLSLGAEWQPLAWLTFSSNLRHVSARRFDNDEANRFGELVASYTMLDAKLQIALHGWKLSAGVDNLTDERAVDYAAASTTSARYSAYALPERRYLVSLGWDF